MSTINGLPAHILLVHFIVVLAPLVAILEIVTGFWKKARSRLVWLVLGLAALTLVMTPLTTSAGEWLERRLPRSAVIQNHTEIADSMIYFSGALFLIALILTFVHLRERKENAMKPAIMVVVGVIALVIGVGSMVQVYRIGDSGAQATWGDQMGDINSATPAPEGN